MDPIASAPGASLNLLLRGGTALLLIVLAALVWRAPPRSAATRLGAAFAFGVAAATLAAAPGYADWAVAARVPIAALAAGNMFVFWLFTRALLDDAFGLRAWHAGVWLVLAALGVASCLGVAAPQTPSAQLLGLVMGMSPVAWALLAVLQSLASWREDLVEERRRLRGLIVVATAGYTIGQWLAAWLGGMSLRLVVESPANAAGTALLAAYFAWRLLQSRDGALFGADWAIQPAPTAPPPDAAASWREAAGGSTPEIGAGAAIEPPFDATPAAAIAARGDPVDADEAPPAPADPRQVATLARLMTQQRVYREPSLTVAALALRMGLPEHRLRRLINQGLGHRHFSAFLNGYRVADAQQALSDPARAAVPVLTIAMDAGFQSIGPFNRAFKAATGLTPTEYRRAAAARDDDAEGAARTPLAQAPGLPELAESSHG